MKDCPSCVYHLNTEQKLMSEMVSKLMNQQLISFYFVRGSHQFEAQALD